MDWLSQVTRGVALAALATSGICSAQVYKCVSRDGKIEFSNVSCPTTATGAQVRVTPNSTDMSGSREQTLQAENARLREQLQAQQAQAQQDEARSVQPRRTEADLRAEKSGTVECRNATKKYQWETADANKSRKPPDLTAYRLAMYSACGMR